MTNLTAHFTLEEFTHSQTAARKGLINTPLTNSTERKNLERLAKTMEDVRIILDSHPIFISSGYRSPAVNNEVGGSKTSTHMHGLAADFTCPAFGTPLEICKALEPYMQELQIDQLIHEYGTWVHLGLREGAPARHMTLTIDARGARNGFS